MMAELLQVSDYQPWESVAPAHWVVPPHSLSGKNLCMLALPKTVPDPPAPTNTCQSLTD